MAVVRSSRPDPTEADWPRRDGPRWPSNRQLAPAVVILLVAVHAMLELGATIRISNTPSFIARSSSRDDAPRLANGAAGGDVPAGDPPGRGPGAGGAFPPPSAAEERRYRARSAPLIVPGGGVVLDDGVGQTGLWGHLRVSGRECTRPFCRRPEVARNETVVRVEGDVIVSVWSHHYFHFMYDAVLRLWGLRIHGVFEKYENATVLWFGDLRSPPKEVFEMMKFVWPEFPMHKFIVGEANVLYQVDELSTLVATRFNDYHNSSLMRYNQWLVDSMRRTFAIVTEPREDLFVSRRGIRRGVAREDALYAALRSFLPNLRNILPDEFSVAEQAQAFANARLIVAPHGASLTNALFSNWEKVVLIEITKNTQQDNRGAWGTFRGCVGVKKHYLLKCQSVPCNASKGEDCTPWDTQIDVNVQNATETIKGILSGKYAGQTDFVISPE